MADPIIVDDGGSTRIKHVRLGSTAMGEMSGLEDVQFVSGVPQSDHKFPAGHSGFTRVKVVYIDEATGTPTPIPVEALVSGDRVEIVSSQFIVRLDVGATSTLTVLGTGCEPVIDAKQHRRGSKRQRRYVVTNAPPISSVTKTSGGTTTQIFSSAIVTSVYTMVYID